MTGQTSVCVRCRKTYRAREFVTREGKPSARCRRCRDQNLKDWQASAARKRGAGAAPKPNGRRYTDAQRAEWSRRAQAGQSPRAIAEALGVTDSTVRTHLQKSGASPTPAAKKTATSGPAQTCAGCRRQKPEAEFWRHPQTGKPTRQCLACFRERSAAGGRRRQANWRKAQAAKTARAPVDSLTRATARGRDLHQRMARLRALAQAAREKRKRQVADGGALAVPLLPTNGRPPGPTATTRDQAAYAALALAHLAMARAEYPDDVHLQEAERWLREARVRMTWTPVSAASPAEGREVILALEGEER
jgi:hypothetical protein